MSVWIGIGERVGVKKTKKKLTEQEPFRPLPSFSSEPRRPAPPARLASSPRPSTRVSAETLAATGPPAGQPFASGRCRASRAPSRRWSGSTTQSWPATRACRACAWMPGRRGFAGTSRGVPGLLFVFFVRLILVPVPVPVPVDRKKVGRRLGLMRGEGV